MKSIRKFLVIALLATMTLIIFVAALRGYRGSMQQTELLFDEQLHDIADLLNEFPVAAGVDINHPHRKEPESSIAYQVWDNGVLTQRSANAPAAPISPFEPGYHGSNFGGHRWRILARRSNAANHWIIVAERADIRFRVAEELILEAVTPIILGLPVAGFLF